MRTFDTYDLVRLFHDRPEISLATWQAESIEEAKASAARHIASRFNGRPDPSVYYILYRDDEPTARFDDAGTEIENGPNVDCEVCGADAGAGDYDGIGEDVCAACADLWDADYARGYGPRAEINRLRETRN